MDRFTHCVLSWIWNDDGTAAIQRLANGTYNACTEFAETAKPVTDDPREQIVVRSRHEFEEALKSDNRSAEFH
jgi:hypothetical protein